MSEEQKPIPKFESKPKAHIVLEESDTEHTGLVKDTLCDINWISGQGETIGTWSRSRIDGLIHIKLLTSIEALYDRAINTWAEFAKERAAQKLQKARGVRGPAKKKEGEQLDEQTPTRLAEEDKIKFNDMRARLMKLRQD